MKESVNTEVGFFERTFDKLDALVSLIVRTQKLNTIVVRSGIVYPSVLIGKSLGEVLTEEEEYVSIYLLANRYEIDITQLIEIEVNGNVETFSSLEWASASGKLGVLAALIENDFFKEDENPLDEGTISRSMYIGALELAILNKNVMAHEFLRSMVLFKFSVSIEEKIKSLISIYKILESKGLGEISRQYQNILRDLVKQAKKEIA